MSVCIYVCTCVCMYVCMYVCMSARTFQAARRFVFLCATNKRNDTILQVLFVDREQALSEICRRRSCRLFCASAIST